MTFTCPRCSTEVEQDLHGPCATCVTQLRATQGNAARDIDAGQFIPKMNVTPNAVALKE